MRQFFYILTVLVFSNCYLPVKAQQSPLLLVGGGSEEKSAWSDKPYQWFVEQSPNKKVAIISYATVEDSWLSDYFISLGAVGSKDFKIGSTEANDQSIIEELKAYSAFFFKGGDQNKYYNYYQNSLLAELLEEKATEGAVIGGTSAGMAILSSIVYTAEKGSLYPEDGLKNMNSRYFTFKNDLFDLLPNTITDTHFAERGRLPRLISMLAYWKNTTKTNESILGIGVDDKTALCIDKEKKAHIYGTGAVTFSRLKGTLKVDGSAPLRAKDVEVISCVEGQSYDLHKGEKTSEETNVSTPNYTPYFQNDVRLINHNHFLDAIQNSTKPTLVVYDSRELSIENEWGENVHLLDLHKASSYHISSLKSTFEQVQKVVFVNVASAELLNFTDKNQIHYWVLELMKDSKTEVLVFEDVIPFIGSHYSTNEKTKDTAAYQGSLKYAEGLGLLPNTIISTPIFKNSDFNENTIAVLQHGLYTLEVNRSIGLPAEGEMRFFVENGNFYSSYEGAMSALFLEKKSDHYTNANSRRNIVGYQDLALHVMYNDSLLFAKNESTYTAEYPVISSTLNSDKQLYYDIHNGEINFKNKHPHTVYIYNTIGQHLSTLHYKGEALTLPRYNNAIILKAIDLITDSKESLYILQ